MSEMMNLQPEDYQVGDEFQDGRYVIVSDLGQGSYGNVFVVLDRHVNEKKAMKSIFNFDLNRDTLREIEIMKGVDHENVMKYYDSFKTNGIFHNLILEYCDGGHLANLINSHKLKNQPINHQTISEWNKQILRGLAYLHSMKIIHRDIKPENIFQDRLGLIVKIANLDFARNPDSLSKSNDDFCGNFCYMSPQMVNQENYTEKTDIWSFGCVLYELLTLRKAFNGKHIHDILESILKNKPKPIEGIEPEFDFILNNSLKSNETERYSARNLLEAFPSSHREDKLFRNILAHRQKKEISNGSEITTLTSDLQDRFTLSGHDCFVLCVAVTPDSRRLISGSSDKTIRVWKADETAGYTLERVITEHTLAVWTLLFGHESKHLFSGSSDKTIKLFDLDSDAKCLKTLIGHDSYVYALCLSPYDKNLLISGSNDTTIKIWDIEKEICFTTLLGHEDAINHLLLVDERTLVSASGDKTVKCWNTKSNTCERTMQGHKSSVNSLVLLDNRRQVATVSDDATVRIWNLESGVCEREWPRAHDSCINSICLVDNEHVATASDDNTIKVWNVASGECKKVLTGHSSIVYSVIMVPQSDNNKSLIASASADSKIILWK